MQNKYKLNLMLRYWPDEGLATAAWLRERGISSTLLRHYVLRKWLKRAGPGVYGRPRDTPGWQAALHALRRQEGFPFHIGGLSALEIHLGPRLPIAAATSGASAEAEEGERPLFLYGPAGRRLPAWFICVAGRPVRYVPAGPFASAPDESVRSMTIGSFPIAVSVPERAALEMLRLVPGQVGFAEALEFIGKLAELRPDLMRTLLEGCSSVKVRRLFLYCARESGHGWYERLERGRINLGSGKREIVKGGRLDKEFLLTIPKQEQAGEGQKC
ncbi:MAG: type IV toxin-antitoxin system AbiEi family antitoxin [Desulfovibrio sp.]|jgi:hypothetical protein|nr:type IV toxin-antitoxin system AbiEi family antitoxin [Desulfovibrio sp.]